MPRILIVEDEAHLADGLRFNLELEGYQAEVVDSGELALERLQDGAMCDLLILDVMLPGVDGFAVMRQLRTAGSRIPALILTARGHEEDVLHGFDAGADDYLPKPFELPILLARVKGLLRRQTWNQQRARTQTDSYEFNGRTIDFDNLQLQVGDRKLGLTLMEANLLRYLIQHEGSAVSRRDMLEHVWGLREDTDTRPIDNFVVRLRRYIEDEPARPKHLLTVRGVGYRFVANP